MPLSLISLATKGKLNGDSMKGTNKRSAKPVSRGALQLSKVGRRQHFSDLQGILRMAALSSVRWAARVWCLLHLFFRMS